MGEIISLPSPAPIWEIDAFWPPRERQNVEGAVFETSGRTIGGNPSNHLFWEAASLGVGATSQMAVMHNNEIYGGMVQRGGAGAASRPIVGALIEGPLTVQTWPAGFRMPDYCRVSWFQFLFNSSAGLLTEESGIAWIVMPGLFQGWVTAAVGTGAFGIVGDGAGGMVFFAKRGAGTYVTTPLAWPGALGEVALVDVVFRAASGAAPASLDIFLNGVLAIARTWAPGTTLPEYVHGQGANSIKFMPTPQANDAAVTRITIGPMRYRVGRLNIDGAAVG